MSSLEAMTAIATQPPSDSTDSLLHPSPRLDPTLTGLPGLGIAATSDPMAKLADLATLQYFGVRRLV